MVGSLSKKEIRRFITEKRDKISTEQKNIWDGKIYDSLINSEFYAKARVIFTFVSFRSEADTHRFINHAVEDGKIICAPKIASKQGGMEVFKISGMPDLKKGYFGILEPMDKCPKVNADEIDLIIMPGLAFDREGGRIGYGGGFYDRFLRRAKVGIPKIALAYNFQVLDSVPADENDIRVDGIITDKEIIFTKNGGCLMMRRKA